jgi:hypothetical protein
MVCAIMAKTASAAFEAIEHLHPAALKGLGKLFDAALE